MKNRLAFFTIGLLILTLGVVLIIKANLGASAWDALAVGESNMFSITIGTAVFINGVILIFINAILMKKRPEILAAATILVIGALIDFWALVVFKNFSPQTPALQYTALVFGIFAVGIGVAIYLQAKFPSSPMDTLMVAIHTRFNLSLRTSRILSESFALVMAFLFKGAIGIGTIIVTLSLGFIVQFFFPIFERLLHKKKQASETV